MVDHALLMVGLRGMLTVASNLMLRRGIVGARGFGLSLSTLVSDLLRMACQPLCVAGLALYATPTLVWSRVISVENMHSEDRLLVSLTFALIALEAAVIFCEPVLWQVWG